MTFLLACDPLSHAVCRHPSPQAVDESPDHLDRTRVESILRGVFGVFER